MDFLLDIAKTQGIGYATIAIFAYYMSKQLAKANARQEKSEDWIRGILATCINNNTEAMAKNSEAINSLEDTVSSKLVSVDRRVHNYHTEARRKDDSHEE